MSKPIEINDAALLAFDTLESQLDLSLFTAGYEAGMRDAFGKPRMAPHLVNEPSWQSGFEIGSECALEAVRQYKELFGR
jgi:hypothetical protein